MQFYGNTSAASIPILLDEEVKRGTLSLGSGQKVVFSGFGGGLAWGPCWQLYSLFTINIEENTLEEYTHGIRKIQEIVAEELGKEKEEIKLNTNIQEDLEADSLDLFQIINEIEDEFDVKSKLKTASKLSKI